MRGSPPPPDYYCRKVSSFQPSSIKVIHPEYEAIRGRRVERSDGLPRKHSLSQTEGGMQRRDLHWSLLPKLRNSQIPKLARLALMVKSGGPMARLLCQSATAFAAAADPPAARERTAGTEALDRDRPRTASNQPTTSGGRHLGEKEKKKKKQKGRSHDNATSQATPQLLPQP